jgi:hypothetical protein
MRHNWCGITLRRGDAEISAQASDLFMEYEVRFTTLSRIKNL